MTLCEQCELKDTCEIRGNHDADDERAMSYCADMKPTRCIDPIIKYCQECRFGHCIYPEWVETAEDLEWCSFETVCMYGFDKGRPEDEPTEEELREFEEWLNKGYTTNTWCETCTYYDTDRDDQPCCNCLDGTNWEECKDEKLR